MINQIRQKIRKGVFVSAVIIKTRCYDLFSLQLTDGTEPAHYLARSLAREKE